MNRKFGGYYKNWRIPQNANAFMVEEKFETWLDLTSLIMLQKLSYDVEEFTPHNMNKIKHIIGIESLMQLSYDRVSPREIRNAYITPTLPSQIIKVLLSKNTVQGNHNASFYKGLIEKINSAAKDIMGLQIGHITSTCSKRLVDFTEDSFQQYLNNKITYPKEILLVFKAVCDFQETVAKYRQLFTYIKSPSLSVRVQIRSRNQWTKTYIKSLDIDVVMSHDVIVMRWQYKTYLLDKDLFLEVYNKVNELFCVLIFNHFQSGVSLPPNQYDMTLRFIKHITNKVVKLGGVSNQNDLALANRGFNYLKIMEGLGVAEMIKRADMAHGWHNDELQINLWNSVIQDHLDTEPQFGMSELFMIWRHCNIPQIAELIGIVKVAGHPSIEIERGLTKLYDRTHELIEVDEDAINRIIAILTRDITMSFYKNYKRYPNFQELSLLACPNINRLINSRVNLLTATGLAAFRNIQLNEWMNLRFAKNEEFDPVDNQLPLLKDKALGLTKSKVLKLMLLKEARVDEEGFLKDDEDTSIPRVLSDTRESRRAILSFLMSTSFSQSFMNYLAAYQSDLPWQADVLDYLVIKLTAKELEEKPEGRLFGASPLEERNRRIVQEYNMMRFLDEFVVDQLMTPNELTMIKKLYSFRHLGKLYPHHTVLQISFDFSKWNNSMRHESIDIPAGIIFDNWFGTNLYGKTMLAYKNSYVYYTDKIRSRGWQGQLGGIEGLNQATWSSIFIGGIKSCLEEIGVIYQLTVKGDDVRAAIAVPNTIIGEHLENLDAFKNRILAELQRLCRAMGWQLNPHECFVSLSLICTSKQYQVNDTWLPASSKKMAKIMSLSNLVFPTIEEIIGNIYSTCHSACAQTTVVIPAYISAVFLSAYTMITGSVGWNITSSELTALLLWPQVLGGPGALPLQLFFVRGENDILSVSVSLFRHALMCENYTLVNLIKKILSVKFKENKNYKQLVADPYSINLDAPIQPKALLRQMIRGHLRGWVKNPVIKPLLTKLAEKEMKEFISVLMTSRPILAKLNTFLWECSPFFLVDEIVSKFLDSSSIFLLFQKGWVKGTSVNSAFKSLNKILRAADKRRVYWKRTLKEGGNGPMGCYLGIDYNLWENLNICTTNLVHLIREASWGFQIFGITYPSLIDQNWIFHPEDAHEIYAGIDLQGCMTQIVIRTNSCNYETDYESHHFASCPGAIPWLGAYTSQKVELPHAGIDVQSPVLSKLKKLINIRRLGAYIGNSYIQLVECLISSLTDVPCEYLLALSPEAGGGQLCHRVVINSFSPVTMPNTRPNLSQLITINNETMTIIQSDRHNRTINFAARHFMMTALSLFPLQFQEKMPDEYPHILEAVFHGQVDDQMRYQLCNWCCNIVDDPRVEFDTTYLPDLSRFRQLSLVGTSPYDKEVLSKCIENSVKLYARRTLDTHHADINNPVLVEAASILVINKLMRDNMNLYRAAQSLQFGHVPTGALLNVFSIQLGIRNIDATSISLNAIRAIPPINLYYSVFVAVYTWYFDIIADSSDSSILGIVNYLLPHYDSLSPLFQHIANANSLRKLSLGCRQVNYIKSPLIWPHGAMTNGHIAAMAFIRAHFDSMNRTFWTFDPPPPAEVKFFLNMENQDRIQDYILQEYLKVKKYLIHVVLHHNKYTHITNHLSARLKGIFNLEDENWNDLTEEQLQALNFEDVIHYMGRINDDALRSILLTLTKLSTILRLEFSMHSLIDEDPNYGNALHNAAVQIIYFNEDFFDNIDHLNNVILENLDASSFLWSTISEPQLRAMIRMMNIVLNSNLWDEYVGDNFDSIMRALESRVQWTGLRYISVLTMEDALRIIRNPNRAGFAINEEELVRAIVEDAEEHDAVDNEDVPYHCALPHNEQVAQLDQTDIWHRGTNIIDNSGLAYLHQSLYSNNDIEITRYYFADINIMYRVVGGTNLSVARFLECWTHINGFDLIENESAFIALTLGDGGGSLSKIICHKWLNANIVGVSLALRPRTMITVADATVSNEPYEFINSYVTKQERDRVDFTSCYPGDLSNPEIIPIINQSIMRKNKEVKILTCDVDIDFHVGYPGYVDIITNIGKLILHYISQLKLCIIKFYPARLPTLSKFIYMMYRLFPHTHIIRSRAAHMRQIHMILVSTNLHPAQINTRDWFDMLENSLSPFGNLEVCGRIVRDIRGCRTVHKDTMQSGIPKYFNVDFFWRILHGRGLELAPTNIILQRLGLEESSEEFDFCLLELRVLEKLNQWSQQNLATLQAATRSTRLRGRRRGRYIQARSGDPVATFRSLVSHSIPIQIKHFFITELMIRKHLLITGDISYIRDIWGIVLDNITTNLIPIFPQLRVMYMRGVYFVYDGTTVININDLWKSSIENYIRYLGWASSLCSLIRSTPLHVLQGQDRFKPIAINQCCIHNCQNNHHYINWAVISSVPIPLFLNLDLQFIIPHIDDIDVSDHTRLLYQGYLLNRQQDTTEILSLEQHHLVLRAVDSNELEVFGVDVNAGDEIEPEEDT